ncbi:hypothetical protein N665_0391s0004 [Sinapis alba]|nr:hypothetical protein N665_0391s0004 [Sinapis alba]
MSSPIRRCSLKRKAIATASDSDNGSSTRLLGPKAIMLRGMIPRPMSEDLAALNENEHSVVQFSLDLEEREASGQVAVDDAIQETIPSSQPESHPSMAKDKASAEKAISLHLADLLPMRWTGTDFEFDEEIDPEQRIALGQYTANGIRILVTLTVLAAELGIMMSVCLFEELTTPSITARTGFFYGKMLPKYIVITGKPSKVNFWNQAYFYVKINDASFEDPSITLNGYFNANIDRLSKWSQGGTQSFLEEVEAIRTLSHQHWPDISEAGIQAALKRISRAAITSPSRSSRVGKVNLASLPSYADTIGTPVHEGEIAEDIGQQQGFSQEEPLLLSPAIPVGAVATNEMPIGECFADPQAVEARGEQPTKPDLASREEVVGYPHVVDFRYQHTSVPFVKDNEVPARLFRQIQLKRRGMPELEELSQSNRYREMTRAGAIFFGSANLMVRDYKAKLKAQDEKIASKTRDLKKKRREIAELAYKCGSCEEQIGTLTAEKIAAVEHAEALSKELEELKAWKDGLETQFHNLEQENAEIVLRFETTTKRLRESREHEVRKERLRVETILKNQIAPAYDKMRQFVEEQPSIQSKLALADEAKYQGELQGMKVVEASEIDLTLIGVDDHGSNMAVFSPQDIEDLRS